MCGKFKMDLSPPTFAVPCVFVEITIPSPSCSRLVIVSTAPCLFPMSLNFFFSFRAVMCNLFPGRRSTYPPGLASGLAGSSVDVCVGVRAMSSWSIRTSSAEEFLPHKYRVWLIQVATKFTAALTALSVTTVEGSKSDSPDEKASLKESS